MTTALHRRTLRVLVCSQILGGAGLGAGATVGALLAEDMFNTTRLAGLPSALFTLGGATTAFLVGRLSQQRGRRIGLASGYSAGAVGSAGIVAAAVADNVVLLVIAMFVYGAGAATSLQARYAGADLAPTGQRARSISTVLVATSVGAIAGPNLVEVMGTFAKYVGVPELSGPFLLAIAAYVSSALVVTVFLRPDPLLTARKLALPTDASTDQDVAEGLSPEAVKGIRAAATVMIITQVIMVSIMTMTPVHMHEHGRGLSATGFVIAVHVGGMYLPSLVTGRFVDRFGRRPMVAAGGASLMLAGILAASSPPQSLALLALALGLLGLGWNLGLIGGTSMLVDATPIDRRAQVQGTVDLTVSLAGAAGGLMSGVVVASTSYTTMSIIGGALSLALLPSFFAATRKSVATAA